MPWFTTMCTRWNISCVSSPDVRKSSPLMWNNTSWFGPKKRIFDEANNQPKLQWAQVLHMPQNFRCRWEETHFFSDCMQNRKQFGACDIFHDTSNGLSSSFFMCTTEFFKDLFLSSNFYCLAQRNKLRAQNRKNLSSNVLHILPQNAFTNVTVMS